MDYLTDASNEVQSYFATHDIPTYFYQCLFGELVKIFGMNFVAPCDTGDSYKDQISEYLTLTSGSGGWDLAFSETCRQCDMYDMYEYYSDLDWVRSDIFDGYIVDSLVDALFACENNTEYYKFKMSKENN